MNISAAQPWLNSRQSGVLLHLSSLPSPFGIGNLGAAARAFVDFLASAGFSYWQVCPIGPTGYGDSPYQSFSSFAGNPYFIDLQALVDDCLLTIEEIAPLQALSSQQVNYGALYRRFWPILSRAFQRFDSRSAIDHAFEDFIEREAYWLDTYATFMALKTSFQDAPWPSWPAPFRHSPRLSPNHLDAPTRHERRKHQFFQYIFFQQWSALKDYAAARGVGIIGDMPIYVALDSADCWASPELFALDARGQPTAVAGVPPDYFSETGQLWGNPLYRWDAMEEDGYRWWIDRLKASFALYDVVRLDHFRGFDSYWEIPAHAADASQGRWRKGPGLKLFQAIQQALGQARLIAEDLGYINRDVFALRIQVGLPGMKIVQFAYGHDDNNVNLPHFFDANQVVYTGTHDNNTLRGWYCELGPADRRLVQDYFRLSSHNPTWDLLQAAFASVARLCIVPVQDILDLPAAARMNTPGTAIGNWQWRLTDPQLALLQNAYAEPLLALNRLFDRLDDHRQRDFSAPPLVLAHSRRDQNRPKQNAI